MSSPDPSPIARHVLVSGRVQGVGFRWHARDRARALALGGWVRNLGDGRVEAWVEGSEAAVQAMLDWLAHGPPAARVEALDAREALPEGRGSFDVLR